MEVDVFESSDRIGGKIAAWPVQIASGEAFTVEHGFHGFFGHYFNLWRFLRDTGADQNFRRVDDYLVARADGRDQSFAGVATTPVANLLSLVCHGHLRIRELLTRPRLWSLMALLKYDREQTFAEYDPMSYAEFAREIQLPEGLALSFNGFARAFFATPADMSMAKLIENFHFFYLSHDRGLLYDYPTDDYRTALIDPVVERLRSQSVTLRLDSPVRSLAPTGQGLLVDGERFDYVVMACDPRGVRSILRASPELCARAPTAFAGMAGLEVGARYAVWRVWFAEHFDDPARPDFFVTDAERLLDSVTFYHRIVPAAQRWSDEHGGSVLEFHAYAVPDSLKDEAGVKQGFLADLEPHFPGISSARVLGESFQLERNFPAFHVGMAPSRPVTETPHPALMLAGDWVDLPYPAALMEAACMSGLIASNRIRAREELGTEEVLGVPCRGILAPRRRVKAESARVDQPAAKKANDARTAGDQQQNATG